VQASLSNVNVAGEAIQSTVFRLHSTRGQQAHRLSLPSTRPSADVPTSMIEWKLGAESAQPISLTLYFPASYHAPNPTQRFLSSPVSNWFHITGSNKHFSQRSRDHIHNDDSLVLLVPVDGAGETICLIRAAAPVETRTQICMRCALFVSPARPHYQRIKGSNLVDMDQHSPTSPLS
jgi:hypothetical protein